VFKHYIKNFQQSAFRLETRQSYTVEEEAGLFEAFLRGEPLPEWTPDNNSWLKLIAEHCAAGHTMQRVHFVQPPLSDYLRFEFTAQLPSVQAGEDIRVVDLREHPELTHTREDWWLFDDAVALLLDYDEDGRPGGERRSTEVSAHRRVRAQVLAVSIPLTDYMSAIGP
jgi:hypothetical protein